MVGGSAAAAGRPPGAGRWLSANYSGLKGSFRGSFDGSFKGTFKGTLKGSFLGSGSFAGAFKGVPLKLSKVIRYKVYKSFSI